MSEVGCAVMLLALIVLFGSWSVYIAATEPVWRPVYVGVAETITTDGSRVRVAFEDGRREMALLWKCDPFIMDAEIVRVEYSTRNGKRFVTVRRKEASGGE